jgi:hypothetical protein
MILRLASNGAAAVGVRTEGQWTENRNEFWWRHTGRRRAVACIKRTPTFLYLNRKTDRLFRAGDASTKETRLCQNEKFDRKY